MITRFPFYPAVGVLNYVLANPHKNDRCRCGAASYGPDAAGNFPTSRNQAIILTARWYASRPGLPRGNAQTVGGRAGVES